MSDPKFAVRLVLIRHGQSEANLLPHLICGQSASSPLAPLGKEQSKLLGKRLKYEKVKIDYLISSSAVRSTETAASVIEILDLDPSQMIVSDALVEQSQGQWEGLNRAATYNDQILNEMKTVHIDFCPPGGESMRMVQKRAINFLEPFIERAKEESVRENREVSLFVFTHANLIRTVVQHYMESQPKHTWLIDQKNTAISEIFFSNLGTSLIRINDYAHLSLSIPEDK